MHTNPLKFLKTDILSEIDECGFTIRLFPQKTPVATLTHGPDDHWTNNIKIPRPGPSTWTQDQNRRQKLSDYQNINLVTSSTCPVNIATGSTLFSTCFTLFFHAIIMPLHF